MRSLKVAGLLAYTSILKGNPGVIGLTILILTLVGLNMLFVPSLLNGLVSGANDKLRTTNTGDIVITSGSSSPLLRNVSVLIARISQVPGIAAVTARNTLQAQIGFDENRVNASILGIQPEADQKVFRIKPYLIEGSYLTSDDRDQILLGLQIAGSGRQEIEFYARSLQKVHAGDRVNVVFGNGVTRGYTVKGIFYSQFLQTDTQTFITETEFESLLPEVKDRAASLHASVAPGKDPQSVMSLVSQIDPDLKIHPWQEYAGIVRSMTDSFNVIRTILNVVNTLVAGITVFIVTYIDVTNRRRQIGIQRAIGITSSSITTSYLMRTIFITFLGVVLAILLFHWAITPLESHYPFRFPFGDVFLMVTGFDQGRMALILLGVSIIAASLPVLVVTRMRLLDAIWG